MHTSNANTLTYKLYKHENCSNFINFLNNNESMFILDNMIMLNDYPEQIHVKIGTLHRTVFEFYIKISDDIKDNIVNAVQ